MDAEGTLLIEVDGVKEACEKQIKQITEKLEANHALSIEVAKTDQEREKLWHARRSAYGVFANEVGSCRQCAKAALEFVGAKRYLGRQPHREKGGQSDQSAATGNGVHKSCQKT